MDYNVKNGNINTAITEIVELPVLWMGRMDQLNGESFIVGILYEHEDGKVTLLTDDGQIWFRDVSCITRINS
jgi:hypothetical protein